MTLHSILYKIMVVVIMLSGITIPGTPVRTITGDISDNTFYSDTLYCIIDSITVPPEHTCYIPAGVRFLFQGYSKFMIRGTITIDGQEGNEVIFTSFKDKSVIDGNLSTDSATLIDWEGIHFASGSEKSSVSYLEIRHADYPITSDIQFVTGRDIRVESDKNGKVVVLYKDTEIPIMEFFITKQIDPLITKQIDPLITKQIDPPEKIIVSPPIIAPLQTVPEAITVQKKSGWTTKTKIRVGLVLSTVAFTGATIGSFVYADRHAEHRDNYLSDKATTDDRLLMENATKSADREEQITMRLAGLGIVGAIFSVASFVGIGFTLHL